MANLNKLTLTEASKKLESGDINSVELVSDCLKAIGKNKDLNAFISVLEKEAIEQAKESDRQYAISHSRRSPIDGVPIAIKDNMAMKGTITTAGSKILENFKSPYDATVVKKLKEAGAVIIGKTNMDEFAMGSSTETSAFGPTKNPYDLKRVPGGSSGGSAAAVAADMCIAALGSDTGGSIRQPAAFCGIVGLKPTYGTVSRYGLLAMASSLDQIGPMTRTVEDAEILFNIIAGYDDKDSTSLKSKSQIPNNKQITNSKLQKIKIGIPKEYFISGMDKEIERQSQEVIKKLEKSGFVFVGLNLPHTAYALSAYYLIMPVEVSSNLARYDGIKYGYSTETQMSNVKTQNLLDVYFQSRAQGFGDEAKRRIMLGAYASSAGYYDAYYLQAQKVRTLIKQDFDQAFKKVDLIVTPVTPTSPFKIAEKIDDPLKMYLSDIFTVPVNLAGLPALSEPIGKINQLPIGLQIIGPQFGEAKIFHLAKIIEEQQWENVKD